MYWGLLFAAALLSSVGAFTAHLVRQRNALASSSGFHLSATVAGNSIDDNANKSKLEGMYDDVILDLTTDANRTISSSTKSATTNTTRDNSAKDSLAHNFAFIQTFGAIAGRGEFATAEQKKMLQKVVSKIEATSVDDDSDNFDKLEYLYGTWDLVATNTQLFRGSPFFLAGRQTCSNEQQAKQYDWFCQMHRKALAISNIHNVRQVITRTNKLISEFSVDVGAIPFLHDFTPFAYSGGLPVTITGTIVSTADWTVLPVAMAVGNDTNKAPTSISVLPALELFMDTVEIKGSNVPGLRKLLDQNKLESRKLSDILNQNIRGYTTPKPLFRTTYLDKQFRINRDVDDNIFVYVKTSNSTMPTNFENVDADLGILDLLRGFNDAVTRVYI